MITHLRIDNRLIHGQVAVTWKSYIGAEAIIVCNDKVAADPIQKMALPMAARGSKLLIFTVEETIAYAKEHEKETLFIICKLPTDALEVVKSGVEIKDINVGNAAPFAGTEYVMVTKQIAATKEDAVVYREIASLRGNVLHSQMLPTTERADFLKLLEESKL